MNEQQIITQLLAYGFKANIYGDAWDYKNLRAFFISETEIKIIVRDGGMDATIELSQGWGKISAAVGFMAD